MAAEAQWPASLVKLVRPGPVRDPDWQADCAPVYSA